MRPWFVAAVCAAAFIAVHYTLLRAASGRLPDVLGALVLEGTAVLGIALYYALGPRGTEVATTRSGVLLAAASGLAISGASVLLFYALRRGGPVASTGAIVLGGGVSLSALAAPMAFGESFSVRRAVGVLLGVVAIAVLSQDGKGAP
jgi:bacterial/archaeal transporter family protein